MASDCGYSAPVQAPGLIEQGRGAVQVLLVEDEPAIADTVAYALKREGMTVLHMLLVGEARLWLRTHRPAVLVLDLGLPDGNGLDLCRELRHDADPSLRALPVLMLSARGEELDRVLGLEVGADDYLTKPFSPKELMLRVQAILKRSDGPPGAVDFKHGPFRFDKNSLKFYLDNEPAELTSTEFKLLLFLCERPGKPQDRNDLLRSIWGYSDAAHSRTLDTHMKRLRQKLGSHGAWVETVRGIGYCVAKLVA